MITNISTDKLLSIGAFNYDDRIFKFLLNKFNYVPINDEFYINLSVRPNKYFLKRLKLIQPYITKNKEIQNCHVNILLSHCKNTFIFDVVIKYYYNKSVVLNSDSIKNI